MLSLQMASGQASGGPDKRARQCSSTVTGEPYAMRLLARHPHANCTPNPRHTPSSGVIFIAPDDGRGVDQFIHRGRHGSGLRGAVSQCCERRSELIPNMATPVGCGED
jgi:hypothetical protein